MLIRPKDIIYLKLQCGKVVPLNGLYNWIKILSQLLARSETLYIINGMLAHEALDKTRCLLLELAISGRHRNHYLWLLTKSYSAIPENVRRQTKAIFVWYSKERADLKTIHVEKNVLVYGQLVIARDFLRTTKDACLYIQN